MKRVIISIALVAVMLAAGIINYFSTKNTTYIIEKEITELENYYKAGEKEKAAEKAEQIVKLWDKFSSDNIFLTDKDHVLEIALSTVRIKAMTEEWKDELTEECSYAKMLVALYRSDQTTSLGNIF